MACKEWNTLPMDDSHGIKDAIGLSGMSYDNTGQLGANTWRHVAFIEQTPRGRPADAGVRPARRRPRQDAGPSPADHADAGDARALTRRPSVLNAEALSEFDPQTDAVGATARSAG